LADPNPAVSAESRPVSLSQALLAPLDAIFKAQVHAARSFLNLLLQIGYPHQPLNEAGEPVRPPEGDGATPYELRFDYDVATDGGVVRQRVTMPALALVPVAPLAVESASFRFALRVRKISSHGQMQASEADAVKKDAGGFNESKRPWYLVEDPISVEGTFAPPAQGEGVGASQETFIQVDVKVGRVPAPAGLERLLTSLGQNARSQIVGNEPEEK
jgi:hypothetical protein